MLDKKFSKRDVETLIEAVGDWELVGSQDYSILQQVKDMPLPPEEHEHYEVYKRIKEYYLQQERRIILSRAQRQEDAVFLKAKLMMIRKDMGIADLFTVEPAEPTAEPPAESAESAESAVESVKENAADKLKLAEFFIRDLGVWKHYEDFLNTQQSKIE